MVNYTFTNLYKIEAEKRKVIDNMDLKKLQNGSDIRGIALAGIEGENPNLTEEAARLLTKGFVRWLSEKSSKPADSLKIAVGRDSRLSGAALSSFALEEIASAGAAALDCGLASTPAMYMSTVFPEYKCDGAIMVTASHLPWNRNGFKYFAPDGGLNKSDIKQIIAYAETFSETSTSTQEVSATATSAEKLSEPATSKAPAEAISACPLMKTYTAHLRKLITDAVSASADARQGASEKPLSGLKIVVDAGNGNGGFYASEVLAPLGADVSGSQFLEPDGHFPNHAPNPEDKKAMEAISAQVLKAGADFGLIFDTDVDRSAAVDGQGREIARNGIVAMAAALACESHPGTTIVTDSITSDQLSAFIEQRLGCKHLRYMRGYKNVINKSIELNNAGIDSQLAIETSGHAAFAENYFLDDGAYLATKIVIKAALLARENKTLDSVIAELEEPLEAREVRFPIKAADFASYGDDVLEKLRSWASADCGNCESGGNCDVSAKKGASEEKGASGKEGASGMSLVDPNYEGVRIKFAADAGDGWCLLRKSLHDPIMPLNIESNIEGGVAVIAEKLRPFLAQFEELDISKL